MIFLKANATTVVRVGPFVATDGFTPTATITLTAADEAELLKDQGAAVVDISAATGWSAIANCDGWYDLDLTAAYVDTEGQLSIVVQDDSACLPVVRDFMVMSAAAYDSMFVAKDDGYMDVNIKTIGRTDTQETEADNLETACANYSDVRGLAGTALPTGVCGGTDGLLKSATGINPDTFALATSFANVALATDFAGFEGTDGKVLISTDAQDLSSFLDVNAKAVGSSATAGDTLKTALDGYDEVRGLAGTALPTGVCGGTDGLLKSATGINPDTFALATSFANVALATDFDAIQGTDDKVLISTDAQDLSAFLDVNTKTISTDAISANTLASGSITSDQWGITAVDANVAQINTSTEAASNLGYSAETIVRFTVATDPGTMSATKVYTDLTEGTDDHYNGRIVIFLDGDLQDQASDITDYDGGGKYFECTQLTETPASGDTCIIV